MAEDNEWSYGVGEIGDEEDEQGGEGSTSSPGQEDAGDGPENDDGWRFSLEDLEEDDGEAEGGWLDLSAEVEAGSPEMENVVFVLLGVALGVMVALQLFL